MLNVFYSTEMQSLVRQVQLNPWWIAGLIAGEGSFILSFNSASRLVKVSFQLSLTSTNQHLLWAIWTFFNQTGSVHYGSRNMASYTINDLNSIIHVLIPFCDKYFILGNKALDYAAFREVAFILYNKQHLTEAGLARCLDLYRTQNTGRDYYDPSQRIMLIPSFPSYPNYSGSPIKLSDRPLVSKNIIAKASMPIAYTAEMQSFVKQVQ